MSSYRSLHEYETAWNRCDSCGRFIRHEDFLNGSAIRTLIYPESEFTCETWQNLCGKCNDR